MARTEHMFFEGERIRAMREMIIAGDSVGRKKALSKLLPMQKKDPFQVVDRDGVGSLMKICVELARKANPRIEIGICGEHGGEKESIEFCHLIGLDYVSCSPFRVPIARLAAAQAKIKNG